MAPTVQSCHVQSRLSSPNTRRLAFFTGLAYHEPMSTKNRRPLRTVPQLAADLIRGGLDLPVAFRLWRTAHGLSHVEVNNLLGGRHAAPALSRPGSCPGVEEALRQLIGYPEAPGSEDGAKKVAPGA